MISKFHTPFRHRSLHHCCTQALTAHKPCKRKLSANEANHAVICKALSSSIKLSQLTVEFKLKIEFFVSMPFRTTANPKAHHICHLSKFTLVVPVLIRNHQADSLHVACQIWCLACRTILHVVACAGVLDPPQLNLHLIVEANADGIFKGIVHILVFLHCQSHLAPMVC